MDPVRTNREQLVADLKKILADDLFVEVPVEQMKETDSLNADLGLDSVGMIEFVSIVEERYGLKIDTQESAGDLATLGSTATYVLNQVQKRLESVSQA